MRVVFGTPSRVFFFPSFGCGCVVVVRAMRGFEVDSKDMCILPYVIFNASL